ncbi:MAG: hypothetical protein CVU65_04100 [Deltaproteobacteria bacterium HGW-Deltaproteobacteria-22]|jgi:hypothetical protein|nr:MAG: hypothetical protein CVU65_04100 [Deltaproteobacteria bacterium HGW-Deltaproteobacteria-22]
MLRIGLICLMFLASCARSTGPVKVAAKPGHAAPAPAQWQLDPSRLPAGAQTLGNVQLSRYFPLYESFVARHGTHAGMSAWKLPVNGRIWWTVDTRYTFATEDDAARFLASQQAKLSEGHSLAENPLPLACDPVARLFTGRLVHPGLGTPFFTFVAVGRHRHHVFKFLAAVEIPAGSAEPVADVVPTSAKPAAELRADFLALAAMALAPLPD